MTMYLDCKDTVSWDLGMPTKGSKKAGKQLFFTLPAGARHLLDQLVALQVVGDSHSGVVAYLVETQLRAMRAEFGLSLPAMSTPNRVSNETK